ncbi:MAG: NERD domain-containing protein [Verrucomicrobiota bacterium]|jgi:hypothetical protein|nr:NERD domain-containing protein [Verrucomicrobiota bacterium]
MARILRSESSLGRRQAAIARELRWQTLIRTVVWSVVLFSAVAFARQAFLSRTPLPLAGAGVLAALGIGYELHLREIKVEARNLEGGRRGEHRMAELLAEQLAQDHVILNDLELRVAHERGQIDHLVLAPSGIYILESKYWAGTLTGGVQDAQWTQKRKHGLPRLVKSPVAQCERQRRMFISLFHTGVADDRVYAMAVFTHPGVTLHISGGDAHVFRTREAIQFINARCFDPPVLTAEQITALAEEVARHQG